MNRPSAPDFAGICKISRKMAGEYIFGNTTANNAGGKATSVFCRCGINSGWSNGKDLYGFAIAQRNIIRVAKDSG